MNLLQRVFKLDKRNDLIRLFDKYNARQDNLIEQSYERNVDAYAVVNKIVNVFTACNWIVERQVDGEWEKVEDTTIHELLENPNQNKGYTFSDIDEMLLTYLLCNG